MKPRVASSDDTKIRDRQSGKMLPMLLIAIGAAILGVVTFNFLPGANNASQQAQQQSGESDNAALAALQENLQTSLALPTDFRTIQEFELRDVNNQPLTHEVFNDTWSLVFFGFTHCPDVCPTTLQVMKDVVAKLDAQQQPVPQIVFVSVDPVRDTADIMKQYIAYFNEDFIGITGDVNKLHDLTRSLGIVASFTANDTDPENYGVDHTASLLLVDPQRRVRAKVTPPHEAGKIIADYLTMIAAPS